MNNIHLIKLSLIKYSDDWTDDEWSAYETYSELYDEALYEFINDLKKNKKVQDWSYVPSDKLKKIWFYFGKTGVVRDIEGIDKIADIICYNVAKVDVNTVMTGHTSTEPLYEVEGRLGDLTDISKKLQKQISNYDWDMDIKDRISDYGLEPLKNGVNKLLLCKTPEDKLYAIDRIMNVIHQRSDIASWFIEGGTTTLREIFEEGQLETVEDTNPLQEGLENYIIQPKKQNSDMNQDKDYYDTYNYNDSYYKTLNNMKNIKKIKAELLKKSDYEEEDYERDDFDNDGNYYYIVDLDERGEFQSHVEDRDGNVVIGFLTEDIQQLIEDGYIDYGNDVDGMELYLKQMGFIQDFASLEEEY